MRKTLCCLLTVIISLAVIGCSKTGEKESVEYVKSRCNNPDSFSKVDYRFNKNSRLARLDYKAKNLLGVEVFGRVYFLISEENKPKYISTEGVDNSILDFLEVNHSSDFERLLKGYQRFRSASKDFVFETDTQRYYIDNLDVNSYYSLYSFEKASRKYNRKLKKLKEEYDALPDDFKKLIEEEYPGYETIKSLKYNKVILSGNPGKKYVDWNYEWEQTEEYPGL